MTEGVFSRGYVRENPLGGRSDAMWLCALARSARQTILGANQQNVSLLNMKNRPGEFRSRGV